MKNLTLFTIYFLLSATYAWALPKTKSDKSGLSLFIETHRFLHDRKYYEASVLISNTSYISKIYTGTPIELAKLFCVNNKNMRIIYAGLESVYDVFSMKDGVVTGLTAEERKDTANLTIVIPEHHTYYITLRLEFLSKSDRNVDFKIGMYDLEAPEINTHNIGQPWPQKKSVAWSQTETVEVVPLPYNPSKYKRHLKIKLAAVDILTNEVRKNYVLTIAQNEVSAIKDTVYSEYVKGGKTEIKCRYVDVPLYVTNNGDSKLILHHWSCSPWDIFKSSNKGMWLPLQWDCLNDKQLQTEIQSHETIKIVVPLFVSNKIGNHKFSIGIGIQKCDYSPIDFYNIINTRETSNMIWSNRILLPEFK